jgi:ferredoxin
MAGLHEAIAVRSVNLLKRVSIKKDFAISGGIAKNAGMVRKLADKVGLEPLLADDPQLVGALGAALFARERHRGAGLGEMKIQYGYSDGTGEYFLTVDTAMCTGCGECVEVCPADVFRLEANDAGEDEAVVRPEVRKKLAVLCPGADACLEANGANCHSVCRPGAIEHSW